MLSLVVFIAIIYIVWQILRRWRKMAKYETFNAFMTALVAYAPLVGVIAYFTGEQFGILFAGLFTIGFWLLVIGYFVWDYQKTHKKHKPKKVFPPLASETETAKLHEKPKAKLDRFLKIANWFFFLLEIFEATVFIILPPLTWKMFEVNGVPILTYYNGLAIAMFSLGLGLGLDVSRRVRNPKKIMEYLQP
jgi:phosphoglycerol transferase MdoB-like AlkP superfamily enzyme